jgi:SAM-dependent methyltransferase
MAEKTDFDNKAAIQGFDSVADLYDQYRPGYPSELIESILELTGLPRTGKIVEIGSGTGKATLPFAQRGYSILCLEPGEKMAEVAARNLKPFPGVQFENSRFEDWHEMASTFDLAFSAQAFHWVPKGIGYQKAARALKPHGHLALFWNMSSGLVGPLAVEIDRIYKEIAPELGSPFSANDESIQQHIREIEESGCFGPVAVRRHPWTKRYNTKEYLGLTNTHSDHLRLPEETRKRLFLSIGKAIDKYGGSAEKPYLTVLYVAEKVR